ncbi:MAG: DNA helicase RecQ [Bacteroidetes bacterium]|nr:DNA helicase RecQ [Bacteroidota bacterium]
MAHNITDTDKSKSILNSIFGYDSFRPNQENVIQAILSGKDVFTSMPTGGGKSLCYQIPGMIFDGLTVVISPLIALMKDQVDEAVTRGIPAAFLNSSLTGDEAADIYTELYQGKIKILYLSPERLAIDGYLEKLHGLQVKFFAIDEAHCLSEWGHDFRPDYLFLAQLRKNFPHIPIAAFTATATNQVQKDIIRILKLKNPFVVRASFDRKELYYQIKQKHEPLTQICEFIKEHPDESGIVYRTSRKDVEKTAKFLMKNGIKAVHYHAGLSKEERAKNQELFNNDVVDVVIATIAFGMGINKNNIRYVIHGDLPKSIEGYYQETGRAGRDGLDSSCLLFFSPGDIMKQQYFINQIENPKEQERSKDNLNRIFRFASVNVCRRKQILEYFNEEYNGNCGSCDVCNDETEKADATLDGQKVLSAIARVNEGFGINHIIDIVWGADTEKIRSRNHDKLKTFGVGKDKDKKWWRVIIQELISQEMVFHDSESFMVLRITENGKKILFGKLKFFISKQFTSTDKNSIPKVKIDHTSLMINEELFSKLKDVRTKLAQKKRVPPYIIFSDKTLVEMTVMQPLNDTDFLRVSGVGEKKLKEYGPYFLPVIRDYLKNQDSS